MCFGNNQQTQTQTTTPAPWLTSAAQNNLNFAQNLESTGFQPYTGQQVAPFSPQQSASFGLGTDIANAATPGVGQAGAGLSQYLTEASGPAPTVNAETIASQMSPYMNQYVSYALQPQIANLNNQLALQSQLTQGQATSAGAFGDPRATMLQQNQNANASLQEQGLVGNAYNAAFNTAIGAGAQDVANNLNAQTTNANLTNTQLANLLQGVNTGFAQGTGATNLENTLGAQQTQQSQAGLNAAYNQWLMSQQYPFQTAQLVNQTIGAAQAGAPTTSTTSSPNNAGYGILGSLIGAGGTALGGYFSGQGMAAMAPALLAMSDERLKDDIDHIGKLNDGTNIYTFRYNWEEPGTTHVGVMAQEVEKKNPNAVVSLPSGYKAVDYRQVIDGANDDALARILRAAA